jgi:hypothetical protein
MENSCEACLSFVFYFFSRMSYYATHKIVGLENILA